MPPRPKRPGGLATPGQPSANHRMDMDDDTKRISGIFSSKAPAKAGPDPACDNQAEAFWFIKETPQGSFVVQSLDMDFKCQGEPFEISREQLFEDYHLEPDLSYRLISQPLLVGDHYLATNKPARAEQEFLRIKRIDEDNIRANFGLGLVYLAMDKQDKATYIFNRLVRLEEAFEPEHKHLFNEFGINLRKKHLFEEALKYYFRAKELSAADDHLLLNIARVYYEQHRLAEAEAAAREALAINPDLVEAKRLLEHIWDDAPLPDDLPSPLDI
jgi:tetratricopeptide (TPR) repeat protein